MNQRELTAILQRLAVFERELGKLKVRIMELENPKPPMISAMMEAQYEARATHTGGGKYAVTVTDAMDKLEAEQEAARLNGS